MAFSISGVLGVVLPAREVAEDEVGTASEQLREIVLFLPDIVDLKMGSELESKQSFVVATRQWTV